MDAWKPELTRMIPSYGTQLAENPELAQQTIARTAAALNINA
jgi:malate dehydrogenase (quinone)